MQPTAVLPSASGYGLDQDGFGKGDIKALQPKTALRFGICCSTLPPLQYTHTELIAPPLASRQKISAGVRVVYLRSTSRCRTSRVSIAAPIVAARTYS